MGLDSSLVSLVVRYPDMMPLVQQAGVTHEDFADDWQKVWRYLVRMKRDHGRLPSPDVLSNRYEWVEVSQVRKRDLPILLSDLKKRRTHHEFVNAMLEAVDSATDFEVVGDVIQELQGKLNTLTASNGNSSHLRDLFDPATSAEMVKEIKRRRSGKTFGYPTGLTKLDATLGGLQRQRMIVVMGRPGLGKAQPLSAKVLTPTGWSTMGMMKAGSEVLCPDGSAARVLQVHPQGNTDIYRVTFSDGATTEATADHLWLTETRNERRCGKSSVKTTTEIIDSLKCDDHWNHYIPLVFPVDNPTADLPIDPYVVGVLLGDGHSRQRGGAVEVLLTTADEDLLREVNRLIEGNFVWTPGRYGYRFCDDSTRWAKTTTFRDSLVSLGMTNLHSYNKVIPDIYLKGSVEQRMALLQGLLDTDGEASARTSAVYCSTSKIMATQVRELVWSLGGVATWDERVTSYHHNGEKRAGRTSYRLRITLPEGVPYFRLGRKQSKIVDCGQKRGRAVRTIRSVKLVRKAEAQCISISHPSQLYVTDDYIVTHNSWLDLLFVANTVIAGGKVILYPLEMTLTETAFRLYTLFTQRCFGAEKVLKNFDLSQGRISPKKVVRLLGALEDKFAGQLYVADVGSISDRYTVERMEAEVELHRPDMFWVDYITLMKAPRADRDNESQAIRTLSNGIKGVAQRNDCVGGASAQVNREGLKTNSFIPRLEHIYAGDSIGQDADQVVSINRKGRHLFYALVKNRHGPEFGRTRVRFFVDEGVISESNEDEDSD